MEGTVEEGTVITGSFVPAPAPGAVSADLGAEVVILNRDDGRLHVLDPIAALAWRCFDGEASVDDLVADLSATFEADETSICSDLTALVAQLVDDGLVIARSGGDDGGGAGGGLHLSGAHSGPPRPTEP